MEMGTSAKHLYRRDMSNGKLNGAKNDGRLTEEEGKKLKGNLSKRNRDRRLEKVKRKRRPKGEGQKKPSVGEN